jgi:hypothetical protein
VGGYTRISCRPNGSDSIPEKSGVVRENANLEPIVYYFKWKK